MPNLLTSECFIAQTIALDPYGEWIFIVDQLNTHQSESLVRLVLNECEFSQELGVKGKSGILQSMSSRATFLSDPSHRIRFMYLPKHTSWQESNRMLVQHFGATLTQTR